MVKEGVKNKFRLVAAVFLMLTSTLIFSTTCFGWHGDRDRRDGGGHHRDGGRQHGDNRQHHDRGYHHGDRYRHHGRGRYYYCGSRWCHDNGALIVGSAATILAIGAIVAALPPYYDTIYANGVPYYYYNDVYFRPVHRGRGYIVVPAP